jgi:hypothetical protein
VRMVAAFELGSTLARKSRVRFWPKADRMPPEGKSALF